MELGDPTADQRAERGRLDVALDRLNDDLAELVEAVESGGFEQLDAAAKLALWHRFETFRNRLPLIDHALVADAEATDLPGTYCFSSLTRFLVRVLQLSPGEAAARVRAAAAVGPPPSRALTTEAPAPLPPLALPTTTTVTPRTTAPAPQAPAAGVAGAGPARPAPRSARPATR